MGITRELAIRILKYLDKHKDFYFPFQVVNKECSEEDNNFIEIEPSEWENIEKDDKYQTFQLWENLQNLYEETLALMAKGFLEKITGESLELHITKLAKNYKNTWREKFLENEKIEDYGLNEFIGGKADAYKDCLDLIRNYRK